MVNVPVFCFSAPNTHILSPAAILQPVDLSTSLVNLMLVFANRGRWKNTVNPKSTPRKGDFQVFFSPWAVFHGASREREESSSSTATLAAFTEQAWHLLSSKWFKQIVEGGCLHKRSAHTEKWKNSNCPRGSGLK